jgi:hypothetical protein
LPRTRKPLLVTRGNLRRMRIFRFDWKVMLMSAVRVSTTSGWASVVHKRYAACC